MDAENLAPGEPHGWIFGERDLPVGDLDHSAFVRATESLEGVELAITSATPQLRERIRKGGLEAPHEDDDLQIAGWTM